MQGDECGYYSCSRVSRLGSVFPGSSTHPLLRPLVVVDGDTEQRCGLRAALLSSRRCLEVS